MSVPQVNTSDDEDDGDAWRPRRPQRPRGGLPEPPPPPALPPLPRPGAHVPAIPPEREAYDAARSLAEQRVKFGGHVVWVLLCFVFLWIAADFKSASIVAAIWSFF